MTAKQYYMNNALSHRDTLHLNPLQQIIYAEIKQQKDRVYHTRTSVSDINDNVRDRPICTPSLEACILANFLSQEQEFGKDPFSEEAERLCLETRPQDGWVHRMIQAQNERLRRRTEARKTNKEK